MSHVILAKSIISHGHMQPLPPQGQLVVIICALLFFMIEWPDSFQEVCDYFIGFT